MTPTTQTWVLVGLAGAAGTLLRYALGGWIARGIGEVFPWETFTINAAGCLVVGLIAGALDKGALIPPPLRMALTVGFVGGFTTFSTFALEAFRLAADAQWTAMAGYVLLTNVIGFAAVWAGYRVVLLA